MSSCTNSSNIRSTILTQVIREEADGKRVAFKISSADVGISAGVTLGSVVRYDVATDQYQPSKADDPTTAEVVGIVEKVENGVYTIVASGLIVYPNINQVINSYTGGCGTLDGATLGGSGGSDVFFLSNYCAGKLQLLEPTISGHIVKPVMQRVKVGPSGPNQYNGIVLNYIGYQVAQLADSTSLMEQQIGGVIQTRNTSNIEGFIKVDEPQMVSTEEYPELYGTFQTDYGSYDEKVTVENQPNITSLIGGNFVQKNINGSVYSSGRIVEADSTKSTVTVRKDSTQPKTDITKSTTVGVLKIKPTISTVSKFTVPSVESEVVTYIAKDGNQTVEETLTPYMRAKSSITTVSIPKSLRIEEITSNKIVTNGYDVGSKLQDLEDRVKDMEDRYGIN